MRFLEGFGARAGRVRRLIADPRAEWQRIAAEPCSIAAMLRSVLALAAIGPVARMIGSLGFGWAAYGITLRPTFTAALVTALAGYALSVLAVAFVAFAVSGSAPSFGAPRDAARGATVAGHAATAALLAGLFQLVPGLVFLGVLGFYSFYLLYLGAPIVMRVPPQRARAFGMAMVAAAAVAYVLVFIAIGAVSQGFAPYMTRSADAGVAARP